MFGLCKATVTDAIDSTLERTPDFQLGFPISLSDLLSLPPDGVRYTRDAQGRLALVSPDSFRFHRAPLSLLFGQLRLQLESRWFVVQEGGVGFEPVYSLRGARLGESRLGHKKLEPDLAVWEGSPQFRDDPRGDSASPERLRLVVELLSPSTWRSDLGRGEADAVDRWKTYLAAGVSEYWILNATPEACGLPPRSGLFLKASDDGWQALPGEGLEHAAEAINGLSPVLSGVVRSSLADLSLDLGAFWRDVAALG